MPAMLFLGLPYPVALASTKLAVAFIGVGSGYRYWKAGLIERDWFWWSALLGIPGVVLGTYCSGLFSSESMKLVVGWSILLLVFISLAQPRAAEEHHPLPFLGWRRCLAIVLLVPISFHSGWISAGAGIFTTLLFILLFRFDQRHATALTMTSVGIFWNGTSGMMHVALGHVLWGIAPALIIGAILGSYCGASIGVRASNRFLRLCFLIGAAICACKLLVP